MLPPGSASQSDPIHGVRGQRPYPFSGSEHEDRFPWKSKAGYRGGRSHTTELLELVELR